MEFEPLTGVGNANAASLLCARNHTLGTDILFIANVVGSNTRLSPHPNTGAGISAITLTVKISPATNVVLAGLNLTVTIGAPKLLVGTASTTKKQRCLK